TLLSSQGTVASFVLTLSGFPPGFPSVLRFRLYQMLSASDSLSAGPFDIHYVSRFPRQLIIEFRRLEFAREHAEFDPAEG
ncbi:hypothetical protein, partial [Streptomyces sp. H51]|uniref:hypothetical protein n=1 Tax=Streptomyces sp. H51 TaxID=3111770 RepID=UPI002D799C3B